MDFEVYIGSTSMADITMTAFGREYPQHLENKNTVRKSNYVPDP